jgi:hypothetical protein
MYKEFTVGMTAYLIKPVRGYKAVTLIERLQYTWLVRTSGGWEFQVYEDELEAE